MVPYKAWRRQVKGKKCQIFSLNWKNLSTIFTKILSNMLEKLMRETLEKEFRLVKNQSSVHCYRMLKKMPCIVTHTGQDMSGHLGNSK